MTERGADESLKSRLNAIADQRNRKERKYVEERIREQDMFLAGLKGFSRLGSPATMVSDLEEIIREFTVFGYGADMPKYKIDIWDALRVCLRLRNEFPCRHWSVRETIDPTKKDDDNLLVVCLDENANVPLSMWDFNATLHDLLLAMGKLARNLHSAIYAELVSFIADAEDKAVLYGMDEDQARVFADTVRRFVQILRVEMALVEKDELKALLPLRPSWAVEVEEPPNSYGDQILDEDTANRENREWAVEQYRRNAAEILPMIGTDGKPFDRLPPFLQGVRGLADEMERGITSADEEIPTFDYGFLESILKTSTIITYPKFFRVPEEDKNAPDAPDFRSEAFSEPMPENELREATLAELKRLINASIRMADRIRSETKEKWVRLIIILKNNHDLFNGEFPSDKITAKRDLEEFIETFREARNRLWGDVEALGGKLPRNKVGRPRKKFKGPKTPFQDRQLKALIRFCSGKKDARENATQHANSCWLANRKKWDAARETPQGPNGRYGLGYKSISALARAFRNS